MARERQRLRPTRHPAPGAVAAPSGVGSGVLRLQRLAGNRAVCQILREPAPLLSGVDPATRKHIQIATGNVPWDFASDETFARAAPRELKGFDVQFGAKVPQDKALRTGLQVIAADMLNPDGKPELDSPFRDNSTVTLEFDLKRFKGENGLWQFTLTTAGKNHQLLIDYLGPAPKYDPPDDAATRFAKAGLSFRSDADGSFGGDDKDAVYSAVSLLPAAAAAKLPKGLVFVRKDVPLKKGGNCTPPPANSGGVYCSADNTITLFDRWLKGSQVRYARTTSKVATVLHELGHAIDDADKAAHAAFAKALKADGGTPISGYGAKNTLESYAECFLLYVADPKLLEALRPNVYAHFVGAYGAATAATPTSGASGSGAAPSAKGGGAGTIKAGTVKAGAGSGAAPKH
jgi:hypothetical protein